MRAVHLANLDKVRPVLIMTAEGVRPYRTKVTVAPITSTARGLPSEVPVGSQNGLDHESVVSLDNMVTIRTEELGRLIGYLTAVQDRAVAQAILIAFDLDI